jgi:hypothetical protein
VTTSRSASPAARARSTAVPTVIGVVAAAAGTDSVDSAGVEPSNAVTTAWNRSPA